MIPFIVGAMLLQTAGTTKAAPPIAVPFSVGEKLEYSGRYLILGSGHAVMHVAGIDTIRGVPSWHLTLSMKVSAPLYSSNTVLASWTGLSDFYSRRFTKVLDEKNFAKNNDFQIFPDSGYFRDKTDTTKQPTPRNPMDDVGFMYYLRTARFVEHKTDTIWNYYRKDKNPVIIEVLGREMVQTGIGRKYCWILHPIVEEPNGMFSKGHEARIWISDDGLRLPVKIRSKYPFIGNIDLTLDKYTPGR